MNSTGLGSARISRGVDSILRKYVNCSRRLCAQPQQHVSFPGPQLSFRRTMTSYDREMVIRRRRASIALGSNLGDRVHNLESALRLMESEDIRVVQTSPLYETTAMYYKDQGRFLNGVCEVSTMREPLDLLNTLQEIEQVLGRERFIEKGPRTIDLDIVTYGGERIDMARLIVPHPGLSEREFVLRPLNDILPNVGVPIWKGNGWTSIPVNKLYNRLHNRDHSMSPVTQLSPDLPLIRPEDPSRPTHVMAILNLTPDSFSDGGLHDPTDLDALHKTVGRYIASGATIIDVGGQSTRPGAQEMSASEELERVLPAIRTIRSMPEGKSVAISVDTFLPGVAKEALAAGADIINDISGGTLSGGEMLSVVAEARKTIVLMHMRGGPLTMNSLAVYPRGVVDEVAEELLDRVREAEKAGIPRWRIILDPGIGFAKLTRHNLLLLRNLDKLRATPGLAGLPWVFGTSRKKFIGTITGVNEAAERVMGTAATVTASIAGGADIVRVHDVAEMAQVARMSDAIYRPSE